MNDSTLELFFGGNVQIFSEHTERSPTPLHLSPSAPLLHREFRLNNRAITP
ncbi:MAG: hypothetical protein SAK29_22540 [Scytonema sp. PMC 1069.18]|nr:hypothetical protein [Scytonema sp. PMC 1069.18]MEC4884357.1 hypothetical protein [Scytonema sp. PMC 1070.18]